MDAQQLSITKVEWMKGNHGYVDLGLSVYWATCNVGAGEPSDPGCFWAWGDIKSKKCFTEKNCATSNNEEIPEDITGNEKYDVARFYWGHGWRLPTPEEFQELKDKCSWRWEPLNGQSSQEVKGPYGTIFLPAAGCYKNESQRNNGILGCYWTSRAVNNGEDAKSFIFAELSKSLYDANRSLGFCIRPVIDKPKDD